MRQAKLQDRLAWAANITARAAGDWADAYRPAGITLPLAPANRYLRIPVLFTGYAGKFNRPLGYGEAVAHGIFDYSYTRPGDYLVKGDMIWFIASQDVLQPALCVRTNRILSFSRAAAPSSTGANNYGGVTASTVTPLIQGWPASVLGSSGSGQPSAGLPSDSSVPYWTVLLPLLPGVTLLPSDLMTDDLGRSAVVSAAESTFLGWRLTVKQAVT
jgi:hypothetical protein